MVAVESGSMEPHMQKGDLIFITSPGRFTPDAAIRDTGVVTYKVGQEVGYRTFGSYGSVIIYDNPARTGPPIIHRARFWVEKGENWYPEANKAYIPSDVDNCAELEYCPAPYAGFITKGDANPYYDQVSGISSPVKPKWVTGVAHVRIPYLGWVRLGFASAVEGKSLTVATVSDVPVAPVASSVDSAPHSVDPAVPRETSPAELRSNYSAPAVGAA
jgi:signal peptidase